MIAVDTSSFVAYLEGTTGTDVDAIERALADRLVCLPPAVLAELFSAPDLPRDVVALLKQLPLLDVTQGYWERAGMLRARVLSANRKARLGDALIAQSCLDHDVRLISRDRDFRYFAQAAKLRLVVLERSAD